MTGILERRAGSLLTCAAIAPKPLVATAVGARGADHHEIKSKGVTYE